MLYTSLGTKVISKVKLLTTNKNSLAVRRSLDLFSIRTLESVAGRARLVGLDSFRSNQDQIRARVIAAI